MQILWQGKVPDILEEKVEVSRCINLPVSERLFDGEGGIIRRVHDSLPAFTKLLHHVKLIPVAIDKRLNRRWGLN